VVVVVPTRGRRTLARALQQQQRWRQLLARELAPRRPGAACLPQVKTYKVLTWRPLAPGQLEHYMADGAWGGGARGVSGAPGLARGPRLLSRQALPGWKLCQLEVVAAGRRRRRPAGGGCCGRSGGRGRGRRAGARIRGAAALASSSLQRRSSRAV
jgi:hypothetical protein